jgi:hypothetical protein
MRQDLRPVTLQQVRESHDGRHHVPTDPERTCWDAEQHWAYLTDWIQVKNALMVLSRG